MIRIDTARSRKHLDHRIKTLAERNDIEFQICRFDQRQIAARRIGGRPAIWWVVTKGNA